MKVTRNGLTFSTGKTLYAERAVIGLRVVDAEHGSPELFCGYDARMSLPSDEWEEPEARLTPAECVELADQMLKRWSEFRARYVSDAPAHTPGRAP